MFPHIGKPLQVALDAEPLTSLSVPFHHAPKVRTKAHHETRGKWAVCSGSIDPTDTSPAFAAKREIQEETTLDDNDITLLRRGKPFSLIDEKLETEWTIHPFAWELKPNAKPIQFDWEHTEYQFIKPEDIEKYEHVPQLEVGMKRVMVSDETDKGLAILRNDHERGAQALAVKALEILLEFVRGEEMAKLISVKEFWTELRWRAWHLAKNGRPSMGAAIEAGLFRALALARSKLKEDEYSGSLQTVKSIIESSIEATISGSKQSLQTLAGYFVDFVQKNGLPENGNEPPRYSLHIVTLSASGTLTECLARLIENLPTDGLHVKLSVLESRPGFEGVSFVNKLLATLLKGDVTKHANKHAKFLGKLKIEISSDASVASVIEDADYLLLGGDKVLQNGNVSNKIGSLPAAVLAKTLSSNCKVVAVFETSKIISSNFDSEHPKTEYNDPAELTNAWPSSLLTDLKDNQSEGFLVEVKNTYFEWVSARYIDAYISEEGVLDLAHIARLSAQSVELEKTLFEDL